MFAFDEIVRIASPIAEKHGIKSLALFGSYARGDATESSDLDFLFDDGGAITTLFEYAGLILDLEEAFGVPVDLTLTDGRDREFLRNIAKDVRPIYERPRCSNAEQGVGVLR